MKVTFEGTLIEIKKEIAIFLWEGSIWATKEEIETRLRPSILYEAFSAIASSPIFI